MGPCPAQDRVQVRLPCSASTQKPTTASSAATEDLQSTCLLKGFNKRGKGVCVCVYVEISMVWKVGSLFPIPRTIAPKGVIDRNAI